MRQLEELNLVDDFLVNSLTSHQVYGEPAARCIPECIYHAKLDAGSFKSGAEYGFLRNVFVIFITTYDPFGAARMVYTIKNGCMEMLELPYEDGARTIFLYTKGTEGNPPEDLRELLYYMEHTSEENAKTEDLQRLHEMVTAVKRDRKVGFPYIDGEDTEKSSRRREFTPSGCLSYNMTHYL